MTAFIFAYMMPVRFPCLARHQSHITGIWLCNRHVDNIAVYPQRTAPEPLSRNVTAQKKNYFICFFSLKCVDSSNLFFYPIVSFCCFVQVRIQILGTVFLYVIPDSVHDAFNGLIIYRLGNSLFSNAFSRIRQTASPCFLNKMILSSVFSSCDMNPLGLIKNKGLLFFFSWEPRLLFHNSTVRNPVGNVIHGRNAPAVHQKGTADQFLRLVGSVFQISSQWI